MRLLYAFDVMRRGRRRRLPPAGGAGRSAAMLRPSSSASSKVSAKRAVASAPLWKLTRYSPGRLVSVIPSRRNSALAKSKGEGEGPPVILFGLRRIGEAVNGVPARSRIRGVMATHGEMRQGRILETGER